MAFDFPYDPQVTNTSDALDEAKKYINATVTQLFYTTNMVHDLYYRYVVTWMFLGAADEWVVVCGQIRLRRGGW